MSLKEALRLCPMEACPFRKRNSRYGGIEPCAEWWRYGWAQGFIQANLTDCLFPIREKRYRDALKIGFDQGTKHRKQLETVGTSA